MLQDFFEPGVELDVDAARRHQAVQALIERCGYAAAALTLLPIPGSEIVAVMPIHVGMVVGIGHAYGVEVTRESAQDLILKIGATVGLSLVGSRLATTAAKVLLPGLGGFLSAPFMYASTLAIGSVARQYFEQGGSLDAERIRDAYRETLRQARKSFDPSRMRSAQARDAAQTAASGAAAGGEATSPEDPVQRLEQLKSLLDKGLIEAEEYESVKKRILSEI